MFGRKSNLSVQDVRRDNRDQYRDSKILIKDLKKKKVCAHFVLHLLKLDRKTSMRFEFVERVDNDRNILNRIVKRVTKVGVLCFKYFSGCFL